SVSASLSSSRTPCNAPTRRSSMRLSHPSTEPRSSSINPLITDRLCSAKHLFPLRGLLFRFTRPEIANRIGGITDLREHCRALLAGGGLRSEAHIERALQREPEIADVGPFLSVDGIIEAEHILRSGKTQEHLFAGHVGVHAVVRVGVRDVRTDGKCSIVA